MRLRTKAAALLLCAVMAGGAGAGVYAAVNPGSTASQPHCPAEDSCTADYHDGAWHVTPVADVNRITGTTRQPTCAELAREYGDDGLCARQH